MRKRLQSKSSLTLTIALGAIALAGCQNTGVSEKPIQPALEDLPPWNIGDIQQIYKVSAIADNGSGTLREAIELANASPGTDRIVFESDDDLYRKPQTIRLDSALPVITDNLVIDGYIDDMLWKASGVIIDGQGRHRPLQIADNTYLEVLNLTIEHGYAKQGGAILNQGNTLVMGVTLANSGAGKGGAIHNTARLHLINSTITKNSSTKSGGGLFNEAGVAVITNSTFSSNSAPAGGAVFNEGQLQLRNSILVKSESNADCISTTRFDKPEYRNIVERQTGCGTPYSSADPMLTPLAYYNGPTQTQALAGRNPAINRGDNSAAVDVYGQPLVWDQRGNGDPRFAAGITDIGAFESQPRQVMEVDSLGDDDKRWCTMATDDCTLPGALLIATNIRRFSTITFDPIIFDRPLTLTINNPLPQLVGPVTLDATNNPTITLLLNPEEKLRFDTEQITLKNIVIADHPPKN